MLNSWRERKYNASELARADPRAKCGNASVIPILWRSAIGIDAPFCSQSISTGPTGKHPIGSRPTGGQASVCGRSLGVVDDKDFDGGLHCHKFQTELLLESGEDR